jgi:hypothetical protein
MCMHLAANGLTLSTPPDQLGLVALYLEENGARNITYLLFGESLSSSSNLDGGCQNLILP